MATPSVPLSLMHWFFFTWTYLRSLHKMHNVSKSVFAFVCYLFYRDKLGYTITSLCLHHHVLRAVRVINVYREMHWCIKVINIIVTPLSGSSTINFHIFYGVFLIPVHLCAGSNLREGGSSKWKSRI